MTSCFCRLAFFILAVFLRPNAAMYTFRDEPVDTSVQLGNTAVLHCSVDNYINTTTIVWWSHGEVISHNRALNPSNLNSDQLERYSITGDVSRGEFSLQIVNFTSSDATQYRCQIFAASTLEGFFKFSRFAGLTVAPYDPLCYVESKAIIPMVGDTVNLVCESRNPGFNGDLRWMYSARAFLTGETSRAPVVRNVVTHVLKPNDYDARFMCFEQSRTCFLIPLRRFIPVLLQTGDAQPRIGDTVTYRCVANKDLTPLSYNWLLNGRDTGIITEEFTLGPVNKSHNASVLECAVKHHTGFKGNDSVTIHIQPTSAESGTRTSTPKTAGDSRPRTATFGGVILINNKPVSPGLESTSPLNAVVYEQEEDKSQVDTWDGLLMPFVICASVMGILLLIVIALLTVFLSGQRASNRRIANSKSTDSPPSDCVPLDYVANKDALHDSPSISIGTLKGLKNPAGCGSIDTFELDFDPDSQPEYYTLEHPYTNPYYEGITGARTLDQNSTDTENQGSGIYGIEVSETITPDCELTARNRRFSFGGGPPPPVPAVPILPPPVSMIVPPEFEGNDAEAESLVAAYAITDVARSSSSATDAKLRGGSLKRPLPARPNESIYHAPNVVFANEQPFRRFGSLKSLGQPAVGAMARSNSLKRPLPAKPKDDISPGHRTPDPYRTPTSLFANIPPFLSNDISSKTAGPVPSSESKTDHPDETAKFQLREVPQKYHESAVLLERFSAVTSTSEGDYAEIDSDQDESETDNLISESTTSGHDHMTVIAGENMSQSSLVTASADADNESPVDMEATEDLYAIVDESDGNMPETDTMPQQSSPNIFDGEPLRNSDSASLVSPPSPHEMEPIVNPGPINATCSLLYAKVQKPKNKDALQSENVENLNNTIENQPCTLDASTSPTCASFRTDIPDTCQERAMLQPTELPYALVK